MDIVNIAQFDSWLAERLGPLRCGVETRAYVISVLNAYHRNSRADMSRESVVIAFYQAQLTGDFETFQRIGDWTLWASSMVPNPSKAQRDLLETLGRRSYRACHRMLRGGWPLYGELADELPIIVRDVRCNLWPGRGTLGP